MVTIFSSPIYYCLCVLIDECKSSQSTDHLEGEFVRIPVRADTGVRAERGRVVKNAGGRQPSASRLTWAQRLADWRPFSIMVELPQVCTLARLADWPYLPSRLEAILHHGWCLSSRLNVADTHWLMTVFFRLGVLPHSTTFEYNLLFKLVPFNCCLENPSKTIQATRDRKRNHLNYWHFLQIQMKSRFYWLFNFSFFCTQFVEFYCMQSILYSDCWCICVLFSSLSALLLSCVAVQRATTAIYDARAESQNMQNVQKV